MEILAAFLLSFIPALIYVMILYWLDRYEKEPKVLVGAVFLWGAIVAAGAAFIINTVLGIGLNEILESETLADFATGSFVAPPVEEILKGFAVLIIFLLFYKEFDSILDGIVYAGVTALGFAATENVLYLYEYGFLEDGWEGLWFMFFLRVILGAWNHVSYTAFTGIGLAIARLNKSCSVKMIAPIGGLLISVFIHFIHNTLSTFVEGVGGLLFIFVIDWLGWLFLIIIILWATRREKKRIKTFLADEVERGTLTPGQFMVASSAFKRGIASLNALFSSNYRETRKFYQLCTELAYKKFQYVQVGETHGNTQDMIEKLRSEVERLSPRVRI